MSCVAPLRFIKSRYFTGTACFVALLTAMPSWAAQTLSVNAPPLGYVGPVEATSTPAIETQEDIPPVGYTGPAPAWRKAARPPQALAPAAVVPTATSKAATSVVNVTAPPLGYLGPVGSPRTTAVTQAAATQTAEPSTPVELSAPLSINKTANLAPTPVTVPAPAPTSTSKKPARAEPKDYKDETLITADKMGSDDTKNLIIAAGHVEIVRGDHVLHADRVTYDKNSGVMTADGHVSMLMPSGEVEFAEHQEVTGDMKQAFARKVGVLFPDNSRMAAQTAQRYDGRYMVADHAMFTACNVCKENPDQPPLWQLRADTVTHDKEEQEIYYRDATIDFAGVPIMYTPYMSTPDPTVLRRQGLLSPTPGYSSNIGAFVKLPYYFDIAPDKDMTLSPTFSTTDKAQLALQYRERFVNGDLKLEGSFTNANLVSDNGLDKGDQLRGHINGKFAYDLNSIWRVGTDVQYVSDKSYMHRYNISSADQMISRAYAEGFMGRNYAAVNSYYFEDLRADINAAQPVVLPSATFSALGRPGETWGGRWSFDGSTLVTQRDNDGKAVSSQGPNTRRLSLSTGWQRQFLSNTGLVTTASGLLRADSYWATNVVTSDSDNTYSRALFTRGFEQGNVTFRYPMGRTGRDYQHLLEPIVSFTAAPDVRRVAKQPIEDSYVVEFDETNLFAANRFTGKDLIEGGSRVTYGLRNAVSTSSGARVDVFGGQSYNFTKNSDFPEQSGLNGHASDYVGRFDFAPVEWFNVNYGFRLKESDYSPQRQDAIISAGVPAFRPSARYIEAYQTDTSTGVTDQVRQVSLGFSSALSKYWTLRASHTQAFDPQPGPRNSGGSLSYIDECYAFGLTATHDYTTRADISSGTSVIFHFFLKNIGGLNTDSTSSLQFPAEFRQTD